MRRDKRCAAREKSSRRRGHRHGGSRMNGLGPGQKDVRTIYGQWRGAERVVSCTPFLLGDRSARNMNLGAASISRIADGGVS
jgi:hypothetical protein